GRECTVTSYWTGSRGAAAAPSPKRDGSPASCRHPLGWYAQAECQRRLLEESEHRLWSTLREACTEKQRCLRGSRLALSSKARGTGLSDALQSEPRADEHIEIGGERAMVGAHSATHAWSMRRHAVALGEVPAHMPTRPALKGVRPA